MEPENYLDTGNLQGKDLQKELADAMKRQGENIKAVKESFKTLLAIMYDGQKAFEKIHEEHLKILEGMSDENKRKTD